MFLSEERKQQVIPLERLGWSFATDTTGNRHWSRTDLRLSKEAGNCPIEVTHHAEREHQADKNDPLQVEAPLMVGPALIGVSIPDVYVPTHSCVRPASLDRFGPVMAGVLTAAVLAKGVLDRCSDRAT